MGRAPCCEKNGLKKGPWTPEEDQKLIDYIQNHGQGSWRTLPKKAGLARCGKSCRLRWTNYLRPDIKRGRFSFEEEETIIHLHRIMGNKWSAIAARLPGRTDNEIKNYWNTHIRKRLLRMGIDPVTHKPRLDNLLDLSLLLGSSLYQSAAQIDLSKLVSLEPLLNNEILKMANSLLSNISQNQVPDTINNPQNLLGQEYLNNSLQLIHDQFQVSPTSTQEVLPCLDTSNAQFIEEAQLTQSNVGQQQLLDDQINLWQEIASQANLSDQSNSFPSSWVSYEYLNPSIPPLVSESSEFYDVSIQNCNLVSGVSTPASSSPTTLNHSSTINTSSPTTFNYSSSTTLANINSGNEDARDSYCNDLFKFQITNLLDVNNYM